MSTEASQNRTRTFSWEDPVATAEAGKRLSGMDYLKAIAAGELPRPPISATMDFGIEVIEDGRVVFVLDPKEFHYNPIGMVHGGVASTLLDSALGCAVHTKLPAGAGYSSIDIKVNFLRPISHKTGRIYCEGVVVHFGSKIAFAEGRITDKNGKLYAHGTSSLMLFSA
jgi:uncharacterized protein (TIGR00369 family)